MNIVEIISELNMLIAEKYKDFKGSYLFGSYARGDYTEDSDIDVVALFDEYDRDKQMELYGITADLDYKYDVVISLIPRTLKELERNCVFHNEVVNKGIYYGTT